MRALVIALLSLTTIARADALPSDAALKGKPGDWTAFEVERSTSEGLVQTRAVAILADGTSAWFTGDEQFEQPWPIEHLPALLRELAADKRTQRAAATCKLALAVPCTRLALAGEVTSFGSTSKVGVTALLAAQLRGTGIYALDVTIDGKPAWRLKALGYGTGDKAAWGAVPWKTSATKAPVVGITGSGPSSLEQRFIDLRPELGPLVALMVSEASYRPIVNRYLRRNIQKLRYCYEKEALAKPSLEGSVDVVFEIGADGKVTGASARGLDPAIEQCAAGVVQSLELPKPPGRASVQASFTMHYRR